MLNKRITCKKYFDKLGVNKAAALLNPVVCHDGVIQNEVVCEPGESVETLQGVYITVSNDRFWLVGDIANRLYSYEELGYSPEELKEIINRYKAQKIAMSSIYGKTSDNMDVASLYPKLFVLPGRCNGKTEIQRKVYDYLIDMHPRMVFESANRQYDEWIKRNIHIPQKTIPEIKDVKFNDPATIVFWADGTKTVVKATDEDFDPEKGLAMAITKKLYGNKGNYFNKIKKWTEKYKKLDIKKLLQSKCVTVESKPLPWKIWVEYYDNGEQVAAAVLPNEYTRKSSAVRKAHKLYDYRSNIKWTVSQTNPWGSDN